MSTGDSEKRNEMDKTDGIVWQTTKPQLISRNYSTGNLQNHENRVGESAAGMARPIERLPRSSSFSIFGNTQSVAAQMSPNESFFKQIIAQSHQKKEQES